MDTIIELIKNIDRRLEILERSRSSNEDWITPTMLNSWVDYDSTYNTCQYYKDKEGIVHLKGLVKSGTIGQAIFTLPAGYRPSKQYLIATQTSPNAIGRLDINTSGNVIPTTGSNSWFSLDNVSFRV